MDCQEPMTHWMSFMNSIQIITLLVIKSKW